MVVFLEWLRARRATGPNGPDPHGEFSVSLAKMNLKGQADWAFQRPLKSSRRRG